MPKNVSCKNRRCTINSILGGAPYRYINLTNHFSKFVFRSSLTFHSFALWKILRPMPARCDNESMTSNNAVVPQKWFLSTQKRYSQPSWVDRRTGATEPWTQNTKHRSKTDNYDRRVRDVGIDNIKNRCRKTWVVKIGGAQQIVAFWKKRHIDIIVLCTSGIKDFVYQRAEGELINRIFNATSA